MKATTHNWFYYKKLNWPVCRHCGLVRLKNKATEVAARKPCDGLLDD